NELKSEIDGFVAAFPEFIKRHYADSMTVAATRALTPASGDQWRLGHHLRARQVLKGEEQLSDLYLYYLPGFRVKLRATYPADSARAMTVSALAPRVVPAFAVNPARVADADTGRHISVTVTLAGSEPPIFAQIVAAMVKQGYTIADSSVTAGRIVTAPYFGWPKGSEKEGWHGADSPGVVLMASLEPRGDSTFVALSGRSPVAPGWKDTKVAEQVELMSVIMLAGELPDSKKKKGTAP
ncbi:MAG TPA: hypothetical protein VHM30_14975, partial [Gemmatimonadaceae bacterium]|nr:hypothetical protein [Gemmatimonadaceae bacterium]